jgi:hypothetical protein
VLGKPKSKCHDGKRKKADEEFPIWTF